MTLYDALVRFARDLGAWTARDARVRVVDVACVMPMDADASHVVVRVSLSNGRTRHYCVVAPAPMRIAPGFALYVERVFFERSRTRASPRLSVVP